MTWRDKLKLEPGEDLRLDRSDTKGFMGETEVELYTVVDRAGQVKGEVEYTEHTRVKAPSRTTCHVVQRDVSGTIVVEERWAP